MCYVKCTPSTERYSCESMSSLHQWTWLNFIASLQIILTENNNIENNWCQWYCTNTWCDAFWHTHRSYFMLRPSDETERNRERFHGSQWSLSYGLFTLHGNGTGISTGNWTSTIGNNGSWFLYLSWTSMNISVQYIRTYCYRSISNMALQILFLPPAYEVEREGNVSVCLSVY